MVRASTGDTAPALRGGASTFGLCCALIALGACSSGGGDDDSASTTAGTGGTLAGSGGTLAAASGGAPAIGSGGTHSVIGSGGSTSTIGTGGTPAGTGGMRATMDAGAAPADAAAMGSGGSRSTGQALPPVTDYTQKGPFKTMVEPNTGPDGNYTIYRPDPLGENGFVHSPIIFGPGISTSCAPGGLLNVYTTLLTHLASHGFVTICVNSIGEGPGGAGNLAAMKMGLDWLIAQNDQPGTYQGKLDVQRAATMGYSIGATASTQLSSHEAIATTVSIHGHNTMGDPHGPILLLTGTDDVIDGNRTTLTTLMEAPAILAALPIGHLDVPTELGTGGRYIAPITAWLRYWVNGDENAKHFFWGSDCEMCSSPWITPETNAMWDAQML